MLGGVFLRVKPRGGDATAARVLLLMEARVKSDWGSGTEGMTDGGKLIGS